MAQVRTFVLISPQQLGFALGFDAHACVRLRAVRMRPHLRPDTLALPCTTSLTIDLTCAKHLTSCARRCLYYDFLRLVTLLDTVKGPLVIVVSMIVL